MQPVRSGVRVISLQMAWSRRRVLRDEFISRTMRSVCHKEGLNKFQLLIQLRRSVAQTLRTERIPFALLPLDHDDYNVTERNGIK